MEDTELFGELHEQEENGLYGRKHAELSFLQNVSLSVCTCEKPQIERDLIFGTLFCMKCISPIKQTGS